jgi:hypothetical protein
MSRPSVRRSLATVVVVVSSVSLVSLLSCMKGDQQTLAVQQDSTDAAFIAELAPDTDTVHVNFACATIDSIGFTATGKTAWNILRHRNSPIIWAVAQNAQPVTINSIKGKSGPFPIDTVPGAPHRG